MRSRRRGNSTSPTWLEGADAASNPLANPLADVRQPLRFAVQVVDQDGLSLERPLAGFIRLKADRVPRVAAAIVSRRGGAAPSRASCTVRRTTSASGWIAAKVQISRQNGDMEDSVREVLPCGSQPPQAVVRGEYAIDLSPFKLQKGDELKITLEAFDDRGDREPKSAVSEPLVLQVTDREGILAGLLESDEKSAKQLDAIIQRELGNRRVEMKTFSTQQTSTQQTSTHNVRTQRREDAENVRRAGPGSHAIPSGSRIVLEVPSSLGAPLRLRAFASKSALPLILVSTTPCLLPRLIPRPSPASRKTSSGPGRWPATWSPASSTCSISSWKRTG